MKLTEELAALVADLESKKSLAATALDAATAASNAVSDAQALVNAKQSAVDAASAHSSILDEIEHGISTACNDAGIAAGLFDEVVGAIGRARSLLNL